MKEYVSLWMFKGAHFVPNKEINLLRDYTKI